MFSRFFAVYIVDVGAKVRMCVTCFAAHTDNPARGIPTVRSALCCAISSLNACVGVVRASVAEQVFTLRGFLAKLLLSRHDLVDLGNLDERLTRCLTDLQV